MPAPTAMAWQLWRGFVAFGIDSDLKKHISAIHLKIKRSRGAK